jgi:hypothetical protein
METGGSSSMDLQLLKIVGKKVFSVSNNLDPILLAEQLDARTLPTARIPEEKEHRRRFRFCQRVESKGI